MWKSKYNIHTHLVHDDQNIASTLEEFSQFFLYVFEDCTI